MMPVNTRCFDQDADGYGWFIEATPEDDVEYTLLDGGGLMSETLPPGLRSLISDSELDTLLIDWE